MKCWICKKKCHWCNKRKDDIYTIKLWCEISTLANPRFDDIPDVAQDQVD